MKARQNKKTVYVCIYVHMCVYMCVHVNVSIRYCILVNMITQYVNNIYLVKLNAATIQNRPLLNAQR